MNRVLISSDGTRTNVALSDGRLVGFDFNGSTVQKRGQAWSGAVEEWSFDVAPLSLGEIRRAKRHPLIAARVTTGSLIFLDPETLDVVCSRQNAHLASPILATPDGLLATIRVTSPEGTHVEVARVPENNTLAIINAGENGTDALLSPHPNGQTWLYLWRRWGTDRYPIHINYDRVHAEAMEHLRRLKPLSERANAALGLAESSAIGQRPDEQAIALGADRNVGERVEATESHLGNLNDFVEKTESEIPLEVELAIQIQGDPVLFVNKPFRVTIDHVRYDKVSNRLDLVNRKGQARDFGLPIESSVGAHLIRETYIVLVHLDEETGKVLHTESVPFVVD